MQHKPSRVFENDMTWGKVSKTSQQIQEKKKHALLDNQLEYTHHGGKGRPLEGLLFCMSDGPGVDLSTKATENDSINDEGNCL